MQRLIGLCLAALMMLMPLSAFAHEAVLSAGGSFCFTIDEDGVIWGWGDNTKGQLGNGTKKRAFYAQQAAITLDGNDVVAIDCGNENALFLLSDGTVWTCGPNNYGQQGNSPATGYNYEPVQIPGLEDIVQISSGWGHCMARKSDGTVYGWGRNTGGQVGVGTKKNVQAPEKLPLSGIVDIECGGKYTLALDADGVLWGWGENDQGQLLDTGKAQAVLEPRKLDISFPVREIACGGSTAYALSGEGTVWAWGRNDFWQLGIKQGNMSKVPVTIDIPEDLQIRDIYAYNTHAALITESGDYWTWGMTRCGQLGNGKHPSKSLPTLCELEQPVTLASMGSSGSYIMLEDGTVWANGYGEVGQTGAYPRKTGYVYYWKWTGLNLLDSTWTDPKN
ncbi:MAG: hypothetical protein IJ229_08105 [Clostridia bacterium]|nr:hypothetical protein [Clostridia bacterium]MBR1683992.1 hypothetical protein [Clostridia bacterium]